MQAAQAIETTPKKLPKGPNAIAKEIKQRGLVEIPEAAMAQLQQKFAGVQALAASHQQQMAEAVQDYRALVTILARGMGLPDGTTLEKLDDGRLVFAPPASEPNGQGPSQPKTRQRPARKATKKPGRGG